MCVCSLNYSARKAHAPYYTVICDLSGCTELFRFYLINGSILGKQLLSIKCVFFSVQILFETFLILRRVQRDAVLNVHSSSCKVPFFIVRF